VNNNGNGSELDKLLGDLYPNVIAPKDVSQLGENFSFDQTNTAGMIPGNSYAGAPQPQRGGLRGRAARNLESKWEGVMHGVDRAKCPDWLNEECLNVFSRMLEQTLRGFQLTARRPSHIDPPFTAKAIDVFPGGTGVVAIPAGGAFTTVTSFQIPGIHQRGIITAAGQSAESVAAWGDLIWRITLDGIPLPPWDDVRIQLWEIVPPTPLFTPIQPLSGQTVALQAATIVGGPYNVSGRLTGWYYPVRSEAGNSIRSTLVD